MGLVTLLLFGLTTTAFAQEATDEPDPETTQEPTVEPTPAPGNTYIVRPGDNLFRIALRNGTTTNTLAQLNGIANPRLIFVGQEIRLPGGGDPPAEQPQPPTEAPESIVVQPGDTLNRIAARYDTTVAELLAVNTIANPNLIFSGQRINLPSDSAAVEDEDTEEEMEEETVVEEPEETATEEAVVEQPDEATEADPGMSESSFAYGIQVFFEGQDNNQLINQVNQLGMGWAKIRVDWREIEPTQGNMDFSQLDAMVNSLDSADINIMLTLTNAPTWSRSSQDENGPPDDLNTFFDFVEATAERYTDQVEAYQIWDEPNLRRNWNCGRRMCDTDYLFMLGESHKFIKAIDENTLVISAGLAPTRFNDRINAVDDRLYLETLFSRGLGTVIDGVGVHPGGEANPPDATCCEASPGVESHFESDSFYFLDNITTYRDIAVEYGYEDVPLWVTKFGWGTAEDTDAPNNENQPHYSVNYTSLSEQAVYIPRAFEIAQDLEYVGPMFLYNLNGCQITAAGGLPELCYTSLISPNNSPRTAFTAVQAIDKSTE